MSPAEKMLALTAVERACADGASLRAACQAAGVAVATVCLWRQQLSSRGSLADARREHSGRRPAVALTDEQAAVLRQLVLTHRGSEESAFRAFVRHAACPPDVAAFIRGKLAQSESAPRREARKPRWPESLRRAAHVTADEWDRWYGPDATRSAQITTQRRLTWVFNGRELPLLPHDLWQFDDYSTNKPYQLEYAAGKFRVCRQVLAGLDTFTHGWLGFYHVGKERDAYTGADCLTVILRCLDAHQTTPRCIILEQARWKANALRGIDMANGRRWGDIQESGIVVEYVHDSRGKAEIEAGFFPLQIELDGNGADIGHTRGLHERESDNYLAVNQGRRDPRLCGFLTLAESDEAHFQAATLLNARRKERSAHMADGQPLGFASADELFAEFHVEPRPLAPEHRWLFELPHKQEAVVGSIGRSLVGCTVNGKTFLFVVNGIRPDVFLDDGHKVLIAFDPEAPHKGCAVANADISTKNRESWRMGEMLLGGIHPLAARWDTVPRLTVFTKEAFAAGDFDPPAEDEHWKLRKGALKAAQTAFQAILPGGKRGLRTAARRNRQGDLTEVVFGSETAPAQNSPDTILPNQAKSRAAEPAVCPRPRGIRPDSLDTVRAHPRLKSPHSAPPDTDEDLDALEAAALREAGVLA
jgi:hypothetical protein